MAHEIETIAYANEVPWHGLGTRVDSTITVDEMLKAAGLDWGVKLCPIFADFEDGSDLTQVPGRFALLRDLDRKVLTVTGERWHPLQNADMLGFMRRYTEAGGATLETAGSLRGGRVVWGLANLGHTYEVRPGDKVQGYLLMTSSHERGRANSARLTTVRVVCANTMAMAEEQGGVTYRQNHLAEFDHEAAHAAIQAAHEGLAKCERRNRQIAALKLSPEDAVMKVFGPILYAAEMEDPDFVASLKTADSRPARITKIVESLLTAPGAEPGTGWGALNGFTHWADHGSGKTADSRLQRSWLGDLARAKLDVEAKIVELAE